VVDAVLLIFEGVKPILSLKVVAWGCSAHNRPISRGAPSA
jgi:hypothetical protein